jgi:hypothetical protein
MIKSRRMRWAAHVACMGVEECIFVSGGKARRKVATLKVIDIDSEIMIYKMDLREIEWSCMGWIYLV